MQFLRVTKLTIGVFLCIFLRLSVVEGHNITRILAKHPEFSTFNHYLTATHLASEINRRLTITVCAIDNAGMSKLLAKHYTMPTLRNILSLHVLVDYFGAKKLHQINKGTALSATMFQSSGAASGSSGFVNITILRGGKVGFGAEDNGGRIDATYVKSIVEIPYNISVIQISDFIDSPSAEAPTAAPAAVNLTVLMQKQGCKEFADLLTSTGAIKTFDESVEGGLSLFCPVDDAVDAFMPKYKNLTMKQKTALLLYHGTPVYYSMQMLKSNNGMQNSLATEKVHTYEFTVQNDGETVTLKTKVVTAEITGTLIDQDPVAVYSINKVLQPKELFKSVTEKEVESPAKAPASPKKGKKKPHSVMSAPPIPAGPDESPADDIVADDSGAIKFSSKMWISFILGVWSLGLFFV